MNQTEQNCVQLPNVALSTVYPRCSPGRASIDRRISHPPGPQQQTRYTLLQWVNGTGKFVCLRIFNEKKQNFATVLKNWQLDAKDVFEYLPN